MKEHIQQRHKFSGGFLVADGRGMAVLYTGTVGSIIMINGLKILDRTIPPAMNIVAPNSPSERVKVNAEPAIKPPLIEGNVTEVNVCIFDAPRVCAASSWLHPFFPILLIPT